MAMEHAYGMGFLSALFACRHFTVISKSGSIAVDTDAILAFKPVTVTPVLGWDGLTVLTLAGVTLAVDDIQATLKRLACGFPIPVVFNEVVLDRPQALDSGLRFVDTELGAVHLVGVDQPAGSCSEFEVFLQGLPIYRSYLAYGFSKRHSRASGFGPVLCAFAGSGQAH